MVCISIIFIHTQITEGPSERSFPYLAITLWSEDLKHLIPILVYLDDRVSIYENDIQIHLKIDSPLPGFEPGTSPVASRRAMTT